MSGVIEGVGGTVVVIILATIGYALLEAAVYSMVSLRNWLFPRTGFSKPDLRDTTTRGVLANLPNAAIRVFRFSSYWKHEHRHDFGPWRMSDHGAGRGCRTCPRIEWYDGVGEDRE